MRISLLYNLECNAPPPVHCLWSELRYFQLSPVYVFTIYSFPYHVQCVNHSDLHQIYGKTKHGGHLVVLNTEYILFSWRFLSWVLVINSLLLFLIFCTLSAEISVEVSLRLVLSIEYQFTYSSVRLLPNIFYVLLPHFWLIQFFPHYFFVFFATTQSLSASAYFYVHYSY